jgi:hypothetical protein
MQVGVFCLSIAAVQLTAVSGPLAVSDNVVRVTVTEEVTSTGALYRYTVTNLRSDPIAQFWIGHDFEGLSVELQRPPKGWTPEGGLPAESARSPKGWSIDVITREEADEVRLDWSADEARFELQPGQSATFIVLVDKPEPTYTRSHWTVVDKHSRMAGGTFELLPRQRGRRD